ncbi:MAG: L-ectoine synthase [Sulfitobacter sp.]|nr:L-ectoine synthase [Sulfitobacter sp.]
MIVTGKAALEGTARNAAGPGWTSLRLLVKSDGMGFSMTETQVLPSARLSLHYKHHIEACYCIGGRGQVVESDTGKVHEIYPGVLYAPDAHDRHEVRVPEGTEVLRLICVFSPALQGNEVHGPDGSYAAPE